jgi:hypothetical protein
LLLAGGQSAAHWQIARQQVCATVGCQLVGSRGEFGRLCMPFLYASQVDFLLFLRPSRCGYRKSEVLVRQMSGKETYQAHKRWQSRGLTMPDIEATRGQMYNFRIIRKRTDFEPKITQRNP